MARLRHIILSYIFFAASSYEACLAQSPLMLSIDESTADTIVYEDFDSDASSDFGDGGMFRQAIQERELQHSQDVSKQEKIVMDEPKLAFVNISGIADLPSVKGKAYKCQLEFYDGNGLCFKKPISIAVQGSYSVRYPKKSFTISFSIDGDSDNEEKETEFVIGNWVKQDSYHLKAFYTDVLRGIGEIGYKLYDKITEDRTPFWQRFGILEESKARCFPDGFPCIMFLNGKFHGVYAWQLKKSRKNMNMEKKNELHIHLDGNLSDQNIFGGNVAWSQFEVRNPKVLYCMDGKAYNGDSPHELIDISSKYYMSDNDDEAKKAMLRSAAAKKSIIALSHYNSALTKIEESGTDTKHMKKEIEERFEIESLIDYKVLHHFIYNCDGSLKNWQWFTYDGKKWAVTPYDLDQTFGINLYGVVRPASLTMEALTSGPFRWIDKYYKEEVRERYCMLRNNGTLEADAINSIITDWHDRIGDTFYAWEEKRWPDSPCYSEAICNSGWKVSNEWDRYAEVPSFSGSTTYKAGDIVRYEGRLWEATSTVRAIKPYRRNSNIDSMERITGWVASRIECLDAFYDYDPKTHIGNVYDNNRGITGIYSTAGEQVTYPHKGVYIYKYKDGHTKKILAR